MESKQQYTSAGTSINSTKMPRGISYIMSSNDGLGIVFDYGCGKYINHIAASVTACGGLYYGFGLFNQPDAVNVASQSAVKAHGGADITTCNNVLNVIVEDDIVKSIVSDLVDSTRDGGKFVIAIYEGDKSGVGRATKADCYQRNIRTIEYLQYLPESVTWTVRGGLFCILNSRIVCLG